MSLLKHVARHLTQMLRLLWKVVSPPSLQACGREDSGARGLDRGASSLWQRVSGLRVTLRWHLPFTECSHCVLVWRCRVHIRLILTSRRWYYFNAHTCLSWEVVPSAGPLIILGYVDSFISTLEAQTHWRVSKIGCRAGGCNRSHRMREE